MTDSKVWLDKTDIMERYGVSLSVAYRIIRDIKWACNGGRLPSGKVLISEVEYWETTPAATGQIKV